MIDRHLLSIDFFEMQNVRFLWSLENHLKLRIFFRIGATLPFEFERSALLKYASYTPIVINTKEGVENKMADKKTILLPRIRHSVLVLFVTKNTDPLLF